MCHRYLSALISQSFLDIGSVSRILDGIMKLCLQFCWKIENQESGANTVELEHITEEFNKKSNSLYTILRSSRLAGSQRAPFLRRFLLRLNYNSFFEATARGVMNVVRPRPTIPVLQWLPVLFFQVVKLPHVILLSVQIARCSPRYGSRWLATTLENRDSVE